MDYQDERMDKLEARLRVLEDERADRLAREKVEGEAAAKAARVPSAAKPKRRSR